jgi:hypothetical protein
MSLLSETNDDILVNNPIDEIIKNLTEQELGDENFINEFIKSLEKFKNGLAEMSNKMSNNINPEKYNNELVAIIILCNKLEIDIINHKTPEKRISIIKYFSENLKKKINAIPDEYKTQVNKSEVVQLLENFLSNISNARNRIKNK